MNDKDKKPEFLTTSQAARLLSVSADTVLKWVKAGKIKSRRTLGGHFRIPIDALDMPADVISSIGNGSLITSPDYMYCWEYLASDGVIKPECRECITYRSRSRRCYELRDLPNGLGCLAMQCAGNCEECEYFKLVQNQAINIMVLTGNSRIMKDAETLDNHDDLLVKFVHTEYEMASEIQSFRPDYIVVDCGIGKKRTSTLRTSLFNDARIPVTRIIIASKTKKLSEYCDKEVFGWIRKPFSIEQLRSCIESVPKLEKTFQ